MLPGLYKKLWTKSLVFIDFYIRICDNIIAKRGLDVKEAHQSKIIDCIIDEIHFLRRTIICQQKLIIQLMKLVLAK